jgi:hypothetical protein
MSRALPLLLLLIGAVRLSAQTCPSVEWTPEHVVSAQVTTSVMLLDYDSDGILDLVTRESSSNPDGIYTRRGVGDGTFQAPIVRLLSAELRALADITGDGIVDIVGTGFQSVVVLPGTGTSTGFGAVQTVALNYTPRDLRAGNFDADAANEVVVASSSNDDLFVFYDNQAGLLVETQRVTNTGNPGALGVGDFDGDGHFDVVIAQSGPNIVSVYFRNANGTYGTPVNMFLANQPLRVVVGDIDSDGDPDFLVNDFAVRVVRIYRYSGGRQFTQTTLPIEMPGFPAGCCLNSIDLLLQDVNDDGELDLLTTLQNHATLSGIVTYIGAGDGTFHTPTWVYGAFVHDLAVGDLDGDNVVELVSASQFEQTVYSRSCESLAATLTLHDSALAVRSGTAHVLNFTIAGPANAPSPTGTLQIIRDGSVIANATFANGEATATLPVLPRGTYDVQAVYSGDTNYGGTSVTITLQVTPNQPVAIDARGLTSAIQIGYVIPEDTESITMFRRLVGSPTWEVATSWSAATGLDTGSLTRGVLYEYYLEAELSDASTVQSNVDRAMLFTDDPLAVGTLVKSVHLLELQLAVNEMRAMASLSPFAFDSPVSVSSPVRASHIQGLRTAVNEARSVLGWTTTTFPPITAGVTKILASDVQQLRDLAR